MENNEQSLTDVDFELIRCGNCGGYLNQPPLMAFLDVDNYIECGRCFTRDRTNRKGQQPIENRSLKVLASVTPFPCRNAKRGCIERRIWPQIQSHEVDCLHRPFTCPVCFIEYSMLQLLEHFEEQHTCSLLGDGSLKIDVNSNLDNNYLIPQDSEVFVLQIKHNPNTDIAWTVVNLLEDKTPRPFRIEFTGDLSSSSFVIKGSATFKPISSIDKNNAMEINLKALSVLLSKSQNMHCKILLDGSPNVLDSVELLKEIECPTCLEFMLGKIYMCENGHNVCCNCKKYVSSCPTCRMSVLDVRNLSLEKLISSGLFPCRNYQRGCKYVATLQEIIYHLNYCSFKLPE